MTQPQVEPDADEEPQEEPEVLLPNTTIVTHCILKNDIPRLTKCFEDDTDPYKETILELLNTRDDDGKTPLDIASTLGRSDMVKELLQRGADVSSVTERGFCALHHAAAWGRLDVIKVLVENNCDLQQRNQHNERARETALRYNKTECVDYLDWAELGRGTGLFNLGSFIAEIAKLGNQKAEARTALLDTVKQTQETVQDAEKVLGRLTKEDKSIVLSCCKEKGEWVDNNPGATTQDFIDQKAALDEVLGPIMLKLTEPPPEKPEKKVNN